MVHDNRRMVSRFAAFVIWAAVAASCVFWAMRLWVKPMVVPAHATVVATGSGFNGDLSRVFGTDAEAPIAAGAPPPQTDPRFRLIGVVAPRSQAARSEGLAVIALDDKPPRAYRVGAAVDGDVVLQSVHARGASLGPLGQPAQVALELPALPPPATGVPASIGSLAPPALPVRPLPPPVALMPAVSPAPAIVDSVRPVPPGGPDNSVDDPPGNRPTSEERRRPQ